MFFFFYVSHDHRDLHVLTHSSPTLLASDLAASPPTTRLSASAPSPRINSRVRRACPATGASLSMTTARRMPKGYSQSAMRPVRSEEHTSELQSLMSISYAVFCLKKKNKNNTKLIQLPKDSTQDQIQQ